jgi:hypothetical protein
VDFKAVRACPWSGGVAGGQLVSKPMTPRSVTALMLVLTKEFQIKDAT